MGSKLHCDMERLDLSSRPFLEKSVENMVDGIEALRQDQERAEYRKRDAERCFPPPRRMAPPPEIHLPSSPTFLCASASASGAWSAVAAQHGGTRRRTWLMHCVCLALVCAGVCCDSGTAAATRQEAQGRQTQRRSRALQGGAHQDVPGPFAPRGPADCQPGACRVPRGVMPSLRCESHVRGMEG